MSIQDARRLSPEAQEDLRRRVVRAVVEQEMSQAEAVRTFGISKTAVHNWLVKYRSGGSRALKSKPRGRPKRSRLKGWQAATTVKLNTTILHSRADERVPFSESEELVESSGLPSSALIEVGTEHRLADEESLAAMVRAVSGT